MSTRSNDGEQRILKAIEYLKSYMIEGETLEAWTSQRLYSAISHLRNIVAATIASLIVLKRGLFEV